jgi:hypothetical protein
VNFRRKGLSRRQFKEACSVGQPTISDTYWIAFIIFKKKIFLGLFQDAFCRLENDKELLTPAGYLAAKFDRWHQPDQLPLSLATTRVISSADLSPLV